ncbi:sensor histidine kinase [Luteimicrobium subarcticum]|uniref:sensor histidine kinase n=1 Tax=Luteimicrobium subarcticum TaxID=620910 RepID=UPI001476728B|nr:nitrate- and nitrite sensing domain-containing protein [Luteimicrobium subarcticum]
MSVRGKILAALAVPVLVLFVAAAYIAGQSIGDARVAGAVGQIVDTFPAQDDAIDAMQAERAASVAAVTSGGKEDEATLKAARTATDDALAKRDRLLRDVNLGALDHRVETAVTGTLASADRLEVVRRQVDVHGVNGDYASDAYQAIVDTALRVPTAVAQSIPDRDLARYISAYAATDQVVSQFTVEATTGYEVLKGGQVIRNSKASVSETDPVIIAAVIGTAAIIKNDDTDVNDANSALVDLGIKNLLEAPTGEYQVLRGAMATGSPDAATPDSVAKWPALARDATNQKISVRDSVRTEVGKQTDDTRGAAVTQSVITLGITVLALVLAVVIALAIARQIVRPLRRLTAAAANVREELPRLVEQVAEPGRAPDTHIEQIPVESSDEVGQLARAFNDVNSTTVQVAKEQAALRGSIAEMFVNVARRDQVLLNRQLSFLDDLERTEEDPSALANLFRLDHLATRMRRNAESLLVLAGIDSGRRVRQPMPTSDVIRTASSEIEMYDRIRLVLPVDPLMLGHNALSSAHLLAELFENATRFSEPHTPVEVSTNRTAEGVQVLIRDYGLGMGPDELREATSRVSSQSASEVLGAQRLGLYVVGRLAGRLGAVVQFVSTGENGQGTTAIVNFPGALFVADSAVPLPQPTDPLTAETQAAAREISGDTAPAALPTRESATRTPLPTPEPEVVQAVDLDKLTDGTTATGMPRRRTARPETAGVATSTGAGSVVLPPLASPELSSDLGDEASGWAPPEAPSAAASLPSRPRTPAPAEPVVESGLLSLPASAASPGELPDDTSVDLLAVPDDVVRTSMFSGFRSMNSLDRVVGGEPEAVQAPAANVPEPTVAPEPYVPAGRGLEEPAVGQQADEHAYHALFVDDQGLTDFEVEPQESWAPQFEAGTELPSRTEALPARGAAATGAGDDVASPLWEPAPAGAESSPYSDLGGYFGRGAEEAEGEPAVGAWTDEALPVVPAGEPQAAVSDDVAYEQHAEVDPFAQQLPGFDDLLSNLPTRRDVREAAKRNRGWFRRGSSQQAYTDALRTLTHPTPVVPAPADGAWRTPAPYAPAPAEPQVVESQQAAPGHWDAQPVDDARTPYAGARSYEEAVYEPAGPPVADSAGWQPAAPAPVDLDPARGDHAGPRVVAASPSARSYRPTEPDPLDPAYTVDPVAAKSEWLASAVLYEEMTSLLRTSPSLADAPPTGATYQPMVEVGSGPSLTRRARREQASEPPAGTSDGIDRDAEVLRERLRAFQSATQRAREEASTGTSSLDLDAEFEAAFGRRDQTAGPDGPRGQH